MATPPQQIDPETMDMAALRALADKEMARDAAGRFVAVPPQVDPAAPPQVDPAAPPADPAAPPAEAEPEVDEVVYRREIDLGDGSGKQVFEGATLEELVDKLANAQVHATKKIRELSQTKKVEQARTADEEWMLSQQLLENPTATVKKMVEDLYGEPIETVKAKLARAAIMERNQAETNAAVAFATAHPEFARTQPNVVTLEKYMETFQLDKTSSQDIEKAFVALQASGLLQIVSQETSVGNNTAEQETKRIAEPVQTPVAPRRAGSGITSRRSAPRPPEPTEEELYAMPLDELERRARAAR